MHGMHRDSHDEDIATKGMHRDSRSVQGLSRPCILVWKEMEMDEMDSSLRTFSNLPFRASSFYKLVSSLIVTSADDRQKSLCKDT
jgi:hypothetical protein